MDLLQDMLALAREHNTTLYTRLVDRYDALEGALAAGNRRDERDRLLREAAAVLLPEGRPWEQAKALDATVRRVKRGVCRIHAERLVREATGCARVPGSVRQLYRILSN